MRAAVAIAALVLAMPLTVRAQAHPAPGSSDAQIHFERGLSLADDGNYAAAMVEFRYAYNITHNPLLLFNIAQAHQALGHYVEALDAMRRYETDAAAQLTPARRATVDTAIQRLQNRIGTLLVPLSVPGLSVHIDGSAFDAARARSGIPLSVGTHLVTIGAPGFESREQAVDIVSGVTARLDQALAPVTTGFTVESNVNDALIRVDGHAVGRTPIEGVIPVPQGRHHLEVTREGYVPFAIDFDVSGPGARLTANLRWLDPMPPAIAAHLRIDAHPTNTRATVDGRLIAFDGRDALPPGAHRLVIERAEFASIDRQVTVSPGSMGHVEAWLEPTSFQAERLEQRRALSGQLALTGGILFVAGTAVTVFAVIRSGQTNTPEGWDAVALLLSIPAGVSGLVMGTITGIRYLTQPTAERYRPPRGHDSFRVSLGAGGVAVRWW